MRFTSGRVVSGGLILIATGAGPAAGQHCPLGAVNTSPVRGTMYSAATFDDRGIGVPSLFMCGRFDGLGASGHALRRWEGGSWSVVPGVPSQFQPTRVVSGVDAQGPALFMYSADDRVYRFDGEIWTGIQSPVVWNLHSWLTSLATFDPDGPGPVPARLHALLAEVDDSSIAVSIWGRVIVWDGAGWSTVGGQTVDGHLVVYDRDGEGPGAPVLYTAGRRGQWHQNTNTVPLGYVERYENGVWSPVAQLDMPASLHVHSPGGGQQPLLIVGGSFTQLTHGGQPLAASRVAAWDGDAWHALGQGLPGASGEVQSLATFDPDGAGPGMPVLLAGGTFVRNAGGLADGLAAWDGAAWSEFAGGVQTQSADHGVVSITPFLDETHGAAEPALLAYVSEGTVAGRPAAPIVMLQQGEWTGLFDGPGGAGRVNTLAAFDEGEGTRLFAAGRFERCGEFVANHIARWDGASWSPLGSGLDAIPAQPSPLAFSSAVHDDGGGAALYIGGAFRSAGGVPVFNIARWRGAEWHAAGAGLGGGTVYALQVHDADGAGPGPARLYAGGNFRLSAGADVRKLAVWDGLAWVEVAGGLQGEGAVRALASFDDGGGPSLYVGGDRLSAGGLPQNLIFKLSAAGWSSVPSLHTTSVSSTNRVHALAVHDMGGGPRLYAAGSHAKGIIARLDASGWVGLSTSVVFAPTEAFTARSVRDCRGAALYVDRLRFDAGGVELLDPYPAVPVRSISEPIWLAGRERVYLGGDFHELRYRCPGTCELDLPVARIAALTVSTCYANCDGSTVEPVLNVDDFSCFINEFAAAQGLSHEQQVGSYANCDGSAIAPVLHVDDFTCFINAFAAGCR